MDPNDRDDDDVDDEVDEVRCQGDGEGHSNCSGHNTGGGFVHTDPKDTTDAFGYH